MSIQLIQLLECTGEYVDIILLILLAGLYYVVYGASVMYVEGARIIQWFFYGIFAFIFWMSYSFVPLSYNALQNYIIVLITGFVVYGWLSIKAFWKLPYRAKLEKMENSQAHSLNDDDCEEVERIRLHLASANYKSIVFGVIALVFMIAIKLKITAELERGIEQGLIGLGIYLFLMILVYLVIDIRHHNKNDEFIFITLRPLCTFIGFVILVIII